MAFEGSERFEVVGKLGEGGMGVVYEAIDHDRNMRVALKALRNVNPLSLLRFKREFRALSELSHPNIVNLYEIVADGDDWFFTMELVPGESLISYLRNGRRPPPVPTRSGESPPAASATTAADETGPTSSIDPRVPTTDDGVREVAVTDARPHVHALVDLSRLRIAARQLADALHALHGAGMVHRDLKPSNVRVTPDRRVVLMDFGIVADNTRSQRGVASAVGTPPYMAPEQAAGAPPTAAADWYAFGVVLYLALAGRLPFRGSRREILLAKQSAEPSPPSALVRGVPADLDRLCAELLGRRPHRRPAGQEILRRLGVPPSPDVAITELTMHPIFVGRVPEIDALERGYHAALAGQTVSFTVAGESGMGKSTLVHHFLDRLEASTDGRNRPHILSARAHERESLPYKGFDGVIDDLAGLLAEMPEELLRRVVSEDVGLLVRLFPVLRQVRGLARPGNVSSLNPHDLRSRAVIALRLLLARLSAIRPLVIVVDDLQWAGRDSQELIRSLLRDPAVQRLLFVTAVRSENVASDSGLRDFLGELRELGDHRQLVAGPLSNREQRELVSQMTGDESLLSPLGEGFWSQLAASPLFLVELLRYLEETETASESLERLELDELLARRAGRLADPPRRMIEAMALADEALPLSVLSAATALGAERGERAAAVLRVGYLARVARSDREPWLVCNHDRLRQVLVRRMPAGRSEEIHRALAAALELWPAATPETLARHWLAAGEPGRAVAYLRQAAATASGHLAFDHAAELLQTALDLGLTSGDDDRAALQRSLGDALVLAGRCYEAARVYERAATGASGDDALDLERLAGDNLLRTGHLEEGVAKLRRVLQALGARVPDTRRAATMSFLVRRAHLVLRGLGYERRSEAELPARGLARLDAMYAASTALGMVDHLRGAAIQARHMRAALQLGEERRVLRALAVEIAYLTAGGGRKLERGKELGQRVLARARELGDPVLVGLVLMALGGGEFFAGRPIAAIALLSEGETILTDIADGAEWERVTTRYFLALAETAAGDFEALADTAARSLAVAEQRNDLYARTFFIGIPRTMVLLRDDRPGEASRALDTALDGWPDQPYYIGHYVEAYSRILVELYRGDGEAARAELTRARPHLRGLMLDRMPWVMHELTALEARAALLCNDDARAGHAARKLSRLQIDYGAGIADLLFAALAHRRGDNDDARTRLESARGRFERLGAGHLVAASGQRLAELGDRRGEALSAHAARWAESQKVVDPQRLWNLFAPM